MRVLLSLCLVAASAFALSNKVTVSSQSGSTQTDRVVKIHRYFAQDELCGYPKPYISGVAVQYWQAHVVTRWPATAACAAGAVKDSVIYAQIASLTTAGVDVEFRASTDRSSSGDDAATTAASLSKAQMLAFLGGVWPSRGTYTTGGITFNTSAKTMVSNDHYQVLEPGPLATTILVREWADAISGALTRTTSFGWQCTANCGTAPYDTATWANNAAYYSIRPSYWITFYRTGTGTEQNVQTFFSLDNGWTDRAQDQRIGSAILYRDDTGTTIGKDYSATPYVHTFRARSRDEVWATAPAAYHIDFNFEYLYYSKLILAYGPEFKPHTSAEERELNGTYGWNANDRGGTTNATSAPHMGKAQWKDNDMQGATGGARADITPFPRWDVKWLMMQTPGMLSIVLGNAEAALHAPLFFVDSSTTANFQNGHSAKAFGRIVSFWSRPSFRSHSQTFTSTDAADAVFAPSGVRVSTSCAAPNCMIICRNGYYGWCSVLGSANYLSINAWGQDIAHTNNPFLAAYIATGDRIWLEAMAAKAGFAVTYQHPNTYGTAWPAVLDAGSLDYTRWSQSMTFMQGHGNNVRDNAWSVRNVGIAATFSPDGSPEKAYFTQILNNTINFVRGRLNIDASGELAWDANACTGYNALTETSTWKVGRCSWEGNGQNPLRFFHARSSTGPVEYATNMSSSVSGSGLANYQIPYVTSVYAMLEGWGWPTGSILDWLSKFMVGYAADSALPSPVFTVVYYLPNLKGDKVSYLDSWSTVASGKISQTKLSRAATSGHKALIVMGNVNSGTNVATGFMEPDFWTSMYYKVGDEIFYIATLEPYVYLAVTGTPGTNIITHPAHGLSTGNTVLIASTQYDGVPDSAMGSTTTFYIEVIDANSYRIFKDSLRAQPVSLAGDGTLKVRISSVTPGSGVGAITVDTAGDRIVHPSAHPFVSGDIVQFGGTMDNGMVGKLSCRTDRFDVRNKACWFYVKVLDATSYQLFETAALDNGGSIPPLDLTGGSSLLNVNAGTMTISRRGQFDTTAAAHSAGDTLSRDFRQFPNSGRVPSAGTVIDGSYGPSYLSSLAIAVDRGVSVMDSLTSQTITAQRAFEKYKRMFMYFSNMGGPKDCTGIAYPYACGTPTWSIMPRHKVANVTVTPTATSLIFTYTAPTADACRIGVSTTALASTDDSSDTSDGTVVPARQTAIGSLTTGTPYYYRITCGPNGGTARVSGMATTL